MNIDLSGYRIDELKGLQHDIEEEIKTRQQSEVAKARQRILAIVREAGLSLEELFATAAPKLSKSIRRKKAPERKPQAKYQNPADQSQTWSGRGRKPKWVTEGLAAGKQLSDLRV